MNTNTGNYNADREAARYCAELCAGIGQRESTWTYRDNNDGHLYEITAIPMGDGTGTVGFSSPKRAD